jgi:LCP family protein required for cell wall assembly
MPSPHVQRKRWALLIAATMSGVVLLASGTSWAVSGWMSGQIDRADVFSGLDEDERPDAPASGGARTVLVMGTDAREEDEEHGEEDLPPDAPRPDERTDSMMLVRLHADREHVTVVGLPRDSWVTIPGHEPHKINAAYALGGPTLAVQTVEANTGVRVDHYVELDFGGFIKVVDALGGVEVCVPEPMEDPRAHLDLEAGTHHVDGEEALAYARTRQSADGDLDRIDRQQEVLAAMLDRALSTDLLADPSRLSGFVDATLDSVTVDDDLDTATIRGLAEQLSGIGLEDVTFTQVPVEDMDFRTPGGDSAVTWKRAEADALFAELNRDEPAGDAGSSTETDGEGEADGASPEETLVEVFNGAGIPGLGEQARGALLDAGYDIPESAENWETMDVPQTLVRHPAEQAEAAEALSELLPGSRLERDDDLDGELQVVLGFNHDGVDAPRTSSDEESQESEGSQDAAEDDDAGLGVGENRDRSQLHTNSAEDKVCG